MTVKIYCLQSSYCLALISIINFYFSQLINLQWFIMAIKILFYVRRTIPQEYKSIPLIVKTTAGVGVFLAYFLKPVFILAWNMQNFALFCHKFTHFLAYFLSIVRWCTKSYKYKISNGGRKITSIESQSWFYHNLLPLYPSFLLVITTIIATIIMTSLKCLLYNRDFNKDARSCTSQRGNTYK